MKYQEIYNEYTSLLRRNEAIGSQLNGLPKGYLTPKTIAGREYCYLQFNEDGKKQSRYVKAEQVEQVRTELALNQTLQKELQDNRERMQRLEAAVQLLDGKLFRTLAALRQCSQMDMLPLPQRAKALSFAKAMTSLEGLPASPKTENGLERWAKGEARFADVYLPALKSYRILETT